MSNDFEHPLDLFDDILTRKLLLLLFNDRLRGLSFSEEGRLLC